jgi:hypothetical protein
VTSPGLLTSQTNQSAPTSSMIVGYRPDGGNVLNFTTTTSSLGRGIGVEIKASGGAPPAEAGAWGPVRI